MKLPQELIDQGQAAIDADDGAAAMEVLKAIVIFAASGGTAAPQQASRATRNTRRR